MQPPMHNKRKRPHVWLILAVLAAVLFIAAVGILRARDLQTSFAPSWFWIWIVIAVLIVVAIALAMNSDLDSNDSESATARGPVLSEAPKQVIADGWKSVPIGGDIEESTIVTGDRNEIRKVDKVHGDYSLNKYVFNQTGPPITDPGFFASKADHHEQPFDYEVYVRAQWGDLGSADVNTFLKLERVLRHVDYNPALSAKQQFEQFRLVREGSKPTYGATLCFGESPNTIVAGCETRCFYWEATDRTARLHENTSLQGNLVRQLNGALSFVKGFLRLERQFGIEGRSEEFDLPVVALEEAIANALVHRQYRNRNDSVRVDLFSDRIEIESPGCLPPEVPITALGIDGCSYHRNPLIAHVFHLYGYVERAGTGISRMTAAMLAKGLPAPEFSEGPTGTFKVILRRAEPNAEIRSLHQLPQPPRDFTGRIKELEELTEKLASGGVSSIHGLGGIGKTAMALKLADQLRSRYPDAQFFLDLKGTSSDPLPVAEALAHVIRAYHPTAKLPHAEAELLALYRSVLQGQRALLVMDNAGSAEQVEPLIPPTGSVLLITSRVHFSLPGLFARNLEALSPDDARAMLLQIAPQSNDYAEQIANLCGYLPLALQLAGRALAKFVNLTPADFVRRLQDEQGRLELIEASLNLSYELLSEELQLRWRWLAVFPDTFEETAAGAIWNEEEVHAQDILGELIATSMVEWNETTRRYGLHDLARLFAESRLESGERARIERLHATHYQTVLARAGDRYFEGGDTVKESMALLDVEWQNIRAGHAWAEAAGERDDQAAKLCIAYPDVGAYVLHLWQYPWEQIRWLEAAVSAARRLRQRGSEGAALGNLGIAYADLGENRKAIECQEQYLAIAREVGDRRGEGVALGNLAIAYAALGETRKAIELHKQCLGVALEMEDLRGQGNALGNLGIAYGDLGHLKDAIEMHEQNLRIVREIGDRRGESNALGNLGIAYANLGEPKRAIEFYEKALVIAQEIGDRRAESSALGNLGLAYASLSETRRAIEFYEKAMRLVREIGDRRSEATALGNLGNAYADLGETKRAAEAFEKYLTLARQIADRRAEGNALGNLALTYTNRGETERAIELHQQRLIIARELGDRRGEGVTLLYSSLALDSLGKRTEAIANAEAALAILEQVEHPNSAQVRAQIEKWRSERDLGQPGPSDNEG